MWFFQLSPQSRQESRQAVTERLWNRWGVPATMLQDDREAQRLLGPARWTPDQIKAGFADSILRQILSGLKARGVLTGWGPQMATAANSLDVNLQATVSALETLASADPSMVPLLEESRALLVKSVRKIRSNFL